MKIEVVTATEGCSEGCEEFSIYTDDYYSDGQIYFRRYECRNLKQCIRLMDHLKKYAEQEEEHGREEK